MSTPASRTRALAATLLATLVAGCATTDLPPLSAAGAGFEPLPDELALWQEARAEEALLLDTVETYDDPRLEVYLGTLADRLGSPGMEANRAVSIRVRVIADTRVNAFAYPHGAIYLSSGLLARLANEAQLATVLGHELSHVEYRHLLRHRRAAHNRSVAWSVATVAAAVVIAGEEAEAWRAGDWGRAAAIDLAGDLVVGVGMQLALVAAVNGYGRELEIEADRGGFAKMEAAGYHPGEAARTYQRLLAAAGPESGRAATFFFASHPRLSERVESARAWSATRPAAAGARAESEDAFERNLLGVVRANAVLHLEAGRHAEAEADLLRVLAWRPEDPVTHHQIGRLRLAEAEAAAGLDERRAARGAAERALREAIRLDADLPGPHRELGRLLEAAGDLAGACRSYRHYLELAPDADDAAEVVAARHELASAGACADPVSG